MKNKKSEAQSLGHEICKALTGEQVEILLDKLFAAVDQQALPEILASLDDDMTATVRRIVFGDQAPAQARSRKNTRILSGQKCLEL